MNISSLSINRPVLAIVFSILIILGGGVGFYFLGVRDYPSVDPPVITVSTYYTGANAGIMEAQVTEPLEESINGIDGIRSLTSVSSDGRSTITVEFELSVDLEAAANDVRDRVSRSIRSLPPDIDAPVVSKSDASAGPILSLTLQSDQRDLLGLSEIGNNLFKERLQTITGVSEIRIWGEKKYAMRLMMDPKKLSAVGLSPIDIRSAFNKESIELPSGRIEGTATELGIRTMGSINTREEFNNLLIRQNNGDLLKFADVGRAVLGAENERTLLRGNGAQPMIGIAITPLPGANYINIANEFYNRIEQIKKDMPGDIKLGIALDTTTGIRKAIREVEDTLLIAFILVVLVIYFFLKSWRSTFIPVIAIPVSLISSFFIMYLAGFSINILTLLGIVLATGLVVDDAIVVLENIYHKIENGMDPLEASFKGSSEIFFAIVSTTVTLAAVFLPIIFLQGLTGRLFREFGIVVAGSVVVSAFVSLTLTPVMCSKILKPKQTTGWFSGISDRLINGVNDRYGKWLEKFIQLKWIGILIMIASIIMIVFIGGQLPSELAPLEDKGRIQVMATAPEGASFDYMNDYLTTIMKELDSLPEKQSLLGVTAPGFGATASVRICQAFAY